MKLRFSAALVCLTTLFIWSSSSAQTPRTNVGTLTCLLGAGTPNETGEPRELSCTFRPITGFETKYSGVIKKLRDQAPTADQLVLVWSVFAPDADVPARALEGTYVGAIEGDSAAGARPTGTLIGGRGSSLELRPLTRLPDTVPNGAFLIVELDLKSIRA
jgi:hypothetical protein